MNDADREGIREFISHAIKIEVQRAVAGIDRTPLRGNDGAPGKDGVDGKDVDPLEVTRLVSEAVAAIPTPKDGADGKPGAPGRDGKDADPEAIRAEVMRVVAAIPIPKDGKDGDRGEKGERGDKGLDGRDGREGKDGRDGITEQQLNDGIIKGLVAALGELHLDGRELKIGDRLIAKLAFPLDCGVYQPDVDYEKGDLVSFGGSAWHCNGLTRDKPGTSDAWRLMVKRGRDGKDFEPRPAVRR